MMNHKLRKTIKSLLTKRGESIMEILVAMLVFTISLTALTLIIRFSLNFTMRQILETRQSQDTSNVLTVGFDTGVQIGVPGSTFEIVAVDEDGIPTGIVAEHDIRIAESVLNAGMIGETTIVVFIPDP